MSCLLSLLAGPVCVCWYSNEAVGPDVKKSVALKSCCRAGTGNGAAHRPTKGDEVHHRGDAAPAHTGTAPDRETEVTAGTAGEGLLHGIARLPDAGPLTEAEDTDDAGERSEEPPSPAFIIKFGSPYAFHLSSLFSYGSSKHFHEETLVMAY